MSSHNTPASAPSPLRIAANRRNALKSTGPRTAAGKRRVALNARRRDLCSEELEPQLRVRGEDPREFCRLHRDLLAIFHPRDSAATTAVEQMARTWWEKARRLRDWVAPGQPRTDELDGRLEQLLLLLVYGERQRHGWWRHRLAAVLGRRLGSPSDVRQKIEARLLLFGAKPGQRKYPQETLRKQVRRQFLEIFASTLAQNGNEVSAVAAGQKGSSEFQANPMRLRDLLSTGYGEVPENKAKGVIPV